MIFDWFIVIRPAQFLASRLRCKKPALALPAFVNLKTNDTMREAILIHMGQAGAQIGNACWESPWLEFVRPKFNIQNCARTLGG